MSRVVGPLRRIVDFRPLADDGSIDVLQCGHERVSDADSGERFRRCPECAAAGGRAPLCVCPKPCRDLSRCPGYRETEGGRQ